MWQKRNTFYTASMKTDLAHASAKLIAILAFVLNKSSRVIPKNKLKKIDFLFIEVLLVMV